MTAATSEHLALALDAVQLPGLAARARQDEFHDFLSPHDLPEMLLVDLLTEAILSCPDARRRESIAEVRRGVINGGYDASLEESDEWAAGPEGQAAFNQLLRGK